MYHDISVALQDCASINIVDGRVIVGAGNWPDFSAAISVRAGEIPLAQDDAWVYLDREGQVVATAEFVPYGETGYGQPNPMLDLLAWREGAEWHIKRLVPLEA